LVSVTVTTVLLNVAFTWTTASVTLRRILRRFPAAADAAACDGCVFTDPIDSWLTSDEFEIFAVSTNPYGSRKTAEAGDAMK
jgi:hypothetical protein